MRNSFTSWFRPMTQMLKGTLVTYQELVRMIQTLPLPEGLSLLETLTQSLQADIQVEAGRKSTLAHVRGIFKTEGLPLADKDIEESYADYLIEK